MSSQDAITNLTSRDDNSAIRIDDSGKRPTLTITNLDKLETSPSLTLLSEQIEGLLPQVDLTELILTVK